MYTNLLFTADWVREKWNVGIFMFGWEHLGQGLLSMKLRTGTVTNGTAVALVIGIFNK